MIKLADLLLAKVPQRTGILNVEGGVRVQSFRGSLAIRDEPVRPACPCWRRSLLANWPGSRPPHVVSIFLGEFVKMIEPVAGGGGIFHVNFPEWNGTPTSTRSSCCGSRSSSVAVQAGFPTP